MGLAFVAEEEQDLTLPEDSIHTAKLIEIKPREINWIDQRTQEAKSRQVLEFWFEVTASMVDDIYIGRRVKGEVPAKLTNHPNNRFHNWAETLLGRPIPPGMGLDTDDLIGLSAEISIGHRQDKKDPAKIWEFVDEVMAVDNFDAPPF